MFLSYLLSASGGYGFSVCCFISICRDLVVVKLEEGPDVLLFDPSAQEEGEIGSIRFADSEVITLRYTVTVCRSRVVGE